jgi:hypothetical protein
MSRKHPHRAGNQPVTRRYVAGVVRRARDEIISAIVHEPSEPHLVRMQTAPWFVPIEDLEDFHPGWDTNMTAEERERVVVRGYALGTISASGITITPERIERAVNG